MPTTGRRSSLLLAVVPDVPWRQLASVLAKFRAAEPHIVLTVRQVLPDVVLDGLERGLYDLALAPTLEPSINQSASSQLLWREELAVVTPLRSPLLAYRSVPAAALLDYPLIQWCQQEHTALHRHIASLVGDRISSRYTAISFDFLMALVASGFGIGIVQRSRLQQMLGWGVAHRRLEERVDWFETHLYWASASVAPVAARFTECAHSLTISGDHGRLASLR